jgi:hypothetical protein
MLAYFISQSNEYTIRTQPTASNQFTMSLQDMTTQDTFTASLSGITYEGHESILGFTASITGSIVSEEYRATILNSGSVEPIWHGTVQVYASQSIDKSVYENKNTQYKSNVSENKYIIMK